MFRQYADSHPALKKEAKLEQGSGVTAFPHIATDITM